MEMELSERCSSFHSFPTPQGCLQPHAKNIIYSPDSQRNLPANQEEMEEVNLPKIDYGN